MPFGPAFTCFIEQFACFGQSAVLCLSLFYFPNDLLSFAKLEEAAPRAVLRLTKLIERSIHVSFGAKFQSQLEQRQANFRIFGTSLRDFQPASACIFIIS